MEIRSIEIGLHNKCNLSCPMCARSNPDTKLFPVQELDFQKLKSFLEYLIQEHKLKEVILVGSVCEPTLYYKFFELLTFLKERNTKIFISTNGVSNIDWNRLNTILDKNDVVVFGLDIIGDDNEPNYRGIKIQDVLDNANKLNCYKTAQCIVFKHQDSTFQTRFQNKFQEFFKEIVFEPCYIPKFEHGTEFGPDENTTKIYSKLDTIINTSISCEAKRDNSIYLEYNANIYPCCHINEDLKDTKKESFSNLYLDSTDIIIKKYTKIITNTPYNICKKFCGTSTQQYFKVFGIDP